MGSPPHTWRILKKTAGGGRKLRITSTYVENTPICAYLGFWLQDHLHIRGEYSNPMIIKCLISGSPPHTWRIQLEIRGTTSVDRITSTYVENTTFLKSKPFRLQDHLHIRGEYSKQIPL